MWAIAGLRIVESARAYLVASSPKGLIVVWKDNKGSGRGKRQVGAETRGNLSRLCVIKAAQVAQARRWRSSVAKERRK